MSVHQSHADTEPNRLIEEKSPYLLQHAYNPVDWHAWGDEPFQLALKEDKPVFLSIGYSTCHWCHVMEKESFENETIAEILNEHFISIKVDREERPDIDQVYMIATQAMTGGGGWPMSVFLLPDRKPFYAGTYFPPEPSRNLPGFGELLKAIARAWQEKRGELTGSAEKITDYLRKSGSTPATGTDALDAKWSDIGFAACQKSYDKQFAGFGVNNKFPRPSALSFLHAYHTRTGNDSALAMACDTLEAMAMGGMYDHIGGGFHRYSVDRQWRIPHFEKMLYDQAQLVVSYLEIYQKTGKEFFAEIARETVEYVLRDLRHPKGGLYSAEDADSINPYNHDEHGEGAFYLWEEKEIDDLLGEQDSSIFKICYNVRPDGNALEDPADEFTGRNILFRLKHDHELALESGMDRASLRNALARSKKKLLQRRAQRPRPHLDDKIITAWNGLMITALAKASRILDASNFLAEAERVADFILDRLVTDEGRLLRRWRVGEARFQAVLEDYTFFIQGLLDLHEVSQHYHYLEQAANLMERQQKLFADPAGGYFSSMESDELLTRMKDTYDGAEPSGNSIAAMNALRLGRLLNSPEWIACGEKAIGSFAAVLESYGQAMPMLLTALECALSPPTQLVIAGDAGAEDTEALLAEASRLYLPHMQIIIADGGENHVMLSESLEFLKTVKRMNERATAYFCRNFTCQRPTTDPEKLAKLLQETPLEK